MKPKRIRRLQNSETWQAMDGTSVYYIKIVFDEDLDAVVVYRSYHKDPWISDGERYDSFAAARVSQGLPETEEEADTAAAAADAGWSPSHARLEWTREFDNFSLVFHYDALPVKLWSGRVYGNGTGWAFNDSSGSLYNGSPLPKAEIVRIIAEWCAANLPSLPLPPFPETPHA